MTETVTRCYHHGKNGKCYESAHYQCENCDNWFCAEHGQKGGDRQVQDVGAVAYPSLCDDCITRNW